MADAPIAMWEMQIAFAIGLLGIYAGWRGTIAKMTGFYDLSGAVKTLLYGIVSGVLAASAIDALGQSDLGPVHHRGGRLDWVSVPCVQPI